jgi:Fic family protein
LSRLVSSIWHGTGGAYGLPRAARRTCRYDAHVPDPLAALDVTLSADVAADVSDAERAIQRLNGRAPVVASLESLARLLLRAESVASSRIEGLTIGVARLVRAEAARALGAPVTDRTAAAILGNIEAMALAVGEVTERSTLTTADVLGIHAALMRHSDQGTIAGRVRTAQNWIGGNDYNPCGADFVPPPAEEVPALLDDLVGFMNTDRYPPLVQAAVTHAQFETIHPFADGNGRTGRALIHVVLRRRGLAPRYVPPISLILATRSREYVGGLSAFRYVGDSRSPTAHAGVNQWLSVFAGAAARAATDAERFGQQVDDLVRSWRDRAGPVRRQSATELLLGVLPSAPVVTVATAAKLIGRSLPQTNAAIARLVERGILAQTSLGRRNRAFEAVGVVEALTGFERGLASPDADTRISPPVRAAPRRIGGHQVEQ